MAGSWLSIVEGFGGMRIKGDLLSLNPMMPERWTGYSFKIWFRDRVLLIRVKKGKVSIILEEGNAMELLVAGKKYSLNGTTLTVKI